MSSHSKEFDQNIELAFFNPTQDRDAYIELYKKNRNDLFCKENGLYRYSPYYLLMQDIRFCYGISKQFSNNRAQFHFPFFAGILLNDILLSSIVEATTKLPNDNSKKRKKITQEITKLMQDYNDITPTVTYGLRLLRNALEHRNYKLSLYKNGVKHYFGLYRGSFDLSGLLIKKINNSTARGYESRDWYINVNLYYLVTQNIYINIREKLLNKRCHKKRKIFFKNLNVKTWIGVKKKKK